MAIYGPREDSYFLSCVLQDYLKGFKPSLKILDMGSGSGIQVKTCISLGFKKVLAADIDDESVSYLKKQKLNAVKTDLFSKIKGSFDIIIFNPPYLPEHKHDKKADTTGGKKGYETIVEFLDKARNHLNRGGKIILLYSSLSKPRIIKKRAKELGYKINLLGEKNLFFEKLLVVELN